MKYALSFFLGALVVTIAILTAGGRPAGMFLAGGVTAIMTGCAIAWVAGIARLGRFLLAFDRAYAGFAAPAAPRSASATNGRVTHCGSEKPAPSPRAATPVPRKNHTAAPRANVLSFQKTSVLSTVQQDVVSALCNQGMTVSKAQALVCEVSEGRPGIDFDTLFRSCVSAPRAVNA
jgi:hypothetical protein